MFVRMERRITETVLVLTVHSAENNNLSHKVSLDYKNLLFSIEGGIKNPSLAKVCCGKTNTRGNVSMFSWWSVADRNVCVKY